MVHPVLQRDFSKVRMIQTGTVPPEADRDPQPPGLSLPLKPHQRAVLRRMREMEEGPYKWNGSTVTTSVGLLCDKVGSGKSIEVLARLCQRPRLSPRPLVESGVCVDTVNISVSTVPTHPALPTNLVVVPHSIVGQWKAYVTTHTSLTITAVQRRAHIDPVARPGWEPTDVLLCSATMLRPLAQALGAVQFGRVVVDECTSIALPRCPTLRGCFHWLVSSSVHQVLFPSGTYFDGDSNGFHRRYCDRVQRTGFVRSILAHLEHFPSIGALFLRCREDFVDRSFALPPVQESETVCRPPACLTAVQGIAAPEITRMLHAGDLAGALQLLPCPRGTADTLITRLNADLDARLERQRAKRLYYRELLRGAGLDDEQRRHFRQREAEAAALAAQLEAQREVVVRRVSGQDPESCPVCLERPAAGAAAVTGCCKHLFCASCLQRSLALQRRCPYCREPLTDESMMVLRPDEPGAGPGAAAPAPAVPTKVEAVARLIDEAEAATPGAWRFLVFSRYESFGELQRRLDKDGVGHTRLCGTGPAVRKQVELFARREAPVLLLNASHYGAGLNLEAASHVVLMHRMDADLESQVVGRAQRLGRTAPLRVVRLVHPGE